MFQFDAPSRRRLIDLTPMIDVVFLLLVFFMLASRFVMDTTIPLATGSGQSTPAPGSFRLVDIGVGGGLALNGVPVSAEELPARLQGLKAEEAILLRGKDAALQDLVEVMALLRAAGFNRLVLVE